MKYEEYDKSIVGITNTMLSNFSPDGNELRPDAFRYWQNTGRFADPTPAMLRGSICHSAVIEHKTFDKEYIIFDDTKRPEPDKDFRSTKNKEWKIEKLAELAASKKTIIPKDDYEIGLRVRDKAYKIEPIKEILEYTRNVIEKPLTWEVNGVKYKCKPDINSDIFLADLKTCQDCGRQFIWDFKRYRYHRQSGMYHDGDWLKTGIHGKEFYFIAMETVEPFGMHLYKVSPKVLGYGYAEYRYLGQELDFFIKKNKFPTLAEISPYTEIDY